MLRGEKILITGRSGCTASGLARSLVADHTMRSAISGPGRVGWRDGFRRLAQHLHPDDVRAT